VCCVRPQSNASPLSLAAILSFRITDAANSLAGGLAISLFLDLWHQEDLCRAEVVSLVRSRTPCQGVGAAALRCILSASRQVQPVAGNSRQLAATHKCRQYIPTLRATPTRHLFVPCSTIQRLLSTQSLQKVHH